MNKTVHLIKCTIRSMFPMRYYVFAIAVLLTVYIYAATMYDYFLSVGGGYLFIRIFSPIQASNFSLSGMSLILLPIILLMLISGSYYQEELNYRCRYTIPRTGSITLWYRSNIIALLIVCVVATTIMLIFYYINMNFIGLEHEITFVPEGNRVEAFYNEFSAFNILIYYAAYCIRLFTALFIQILLLLTLSNSRYSFAVPVFIILISCYVPKGYMFLPFGATYISRVINDSNSIGLAFIIMFIYLVIFYIFGLHLVKKRDFIIRNSITK